jgi:haloalkane dehalogenase
VSNPLRGRAAASPRCPNRSIDATPLLERLSREVPSKLGSKPTLIIWGMKGPGFRPKLIPRMRQAFSDPLVVELAGAKHYIQEDAPEEIADAILKRFG